MVVYRIEHPSDHLGPYATNVGKQSRRLLGRALCDAHIHTRPTPVRDELDHFFGKDGEDWFFACPNLETLQEWFNGFWTELIECGFIIVEYKTQHYKLGASGKQLIFDINKASRK